jgi:hypothetical protein
LLSSMFGNARWLQRTNIPAPVGLTEFGTRRRSPTREGKGKRQKEKGKRQKEKLDGLPRRLVVLVIGPPYPLPTPRMQPV